MQPLSAQLIPRESEYFPRDPVPELASLVMMVGTGSRCWAVFCVYITITMASPDTGHGGDWTAGKQDETIYWRPLQFYSLQIFSVSENVQIVTPNKCRWEWLGGTNTGARFIFYIHTRLRPVQPLSDCASQADRCGTWSSECGGEIGAVII